MARKLNVYLHQDLVGQLIQNDSGQLSFKYAENWLNAQGATPLSYSLPLQKEPFRNRQCRGFFAGILPEAQVRETIARNLGISARNDFTMLEQIGGECAGAITFLPPDKKLSQEAYTYRLLSDSALAEILGNLPRRPLMAGDAGIRLSLAGAQDKIAVHVKEGRFSIPLEEAPSTHILKPAIERFEGVVYNEAFCLKLAQMAGLPVVQAETGTVDNIDYLLVERHDREWAPDAPFPRRIHQEDFCQALGIVPETKYQIEGGPSLKACFTLLREISSAPVINLQRLLEAVIFNVLIGNNDAHGKNFSLLYDRPSSGIRLAPLYDILSTAYYPDLSKKMAMKIGGEYRPDKLGRRHFERLAEEAGLARPMVRERVTELAQRTINGLQEIHMDHPLAQKLSATIRHRCGALIESFKSRN